MRRLSVLAVALTIVLIVVAVPGQRVAAEPAWCTGLRHKTALQRFELEAFTKHCDVQRSSAASVPRLGVTGAPRAASTAAPKITTSEELLGAQRPLKIATAYTVPAPVLQDLQTKVTTEKARKDSQTQIAQDQKKAADANAASQANIARSAVERRAMCQYKVNWLSFVAGVASLARAPKLRDGAQVLAFAAPLPFSACEKPIDVNAAPIVAPSVITAVEGATDPVSLKVLESNYSGSFVVTSANPDLVVVSQATDNDGHLLRDQFNVKAIKFSDSGATLSVQDENGASKSVHVKIIAKGA